MANRELKSENPISNDPNAGLIIEIWRRYVETFGLEGYLYRDKMLAGASQKEIDEALGVRKAAIVALMPEFLNEAGLEK